MKRITVAWLLALSIVWAASSESLVLEYLDGSVDVQRAGRWVALDMGSTLSDKDTVRVADGTLAELVAGSLRLTLSSGGSYKVADLLASSRRAASWGVDGLVKNKLKTVMQGSGGQNTSAVMGVRGDRADEPAVVQWEDGEDSLQEGKALLDQGRFADAARLFEQQAGAVDPEEQQMLLFYAGYAWSLAGRNAFAQRALFRVQDDPKASFFPELVLLKGRLWIDGSAWNQAQKLFDLYLESYPTGDQVQEVTYLSGLSWLGAGDRARALQMLKRARDLNAASAVGQEAQSRIQTVQ